MRHKIYVFITGTAFMLVVVVFNFFPRATFSTIEKRSLARFPEFSVDSLFSGAYTRDVGLWYSDTEPFRNDILTFSMQLREALRLNVSLPKKQQSSPQKASKGRKVIPVPEEQSWDATMAAKGIVILSNGDKIRAMMRFAGSPEGGQGFVDCARKYAEAFTPQAKVYAMVVPIPIEFYCPPSVQECTKPQKPFVESVGRRMRPQVTPVNVYDVLKEHATEPIYLRTDHHWTALGAYYAAGEFARIAGVPFRSIKSYDRHVVHGFVGSMYGYSGSIRVKNNPEDFVYYTPRNLQYTTTYYDYVLNEEHKAVRERAPYEGKFFHEYKDGSPYTYGTFMAGDEHLVKVSTATPGNRRLLIVKDSFGNAIPGWLFYSFSELHIADFRYFTRNMRKYVRDNNITDILIIANSFGAYGNNGEMMQKFLDQPDRH